MKIQMSECSKMYSLPTPNIMQSTPLMEWLNLFYMLLFKFWSWPFSYITQVPKGLRSTLHKDWNPMVFSIILLLFSYGQALII